MARLYCSKCEKITEHAIPGERVMAAENVPDELWNKLGLVRLGDRAFRPEPVKGMPIGGFCVECHRPSF